jgi:hypothetical protein
VEPGHPAGAAMHWLVSDGQVDRRQPDMGINELSQSRCEGIKDAGGYARPLIRAHALDGTRVERA